MRILFILLSAMLYLTPFVYAQSSDTSTINTTVKLNICGDTIIEGPEECEGANLNGSSCINLGYAGGNLTCDIACSFDAFLCIEPTSTLTPTVTLTPTPTPAGSITTSGNTTTEIRATAAPTSIITLTDTRPTPDADGSGLPPLLQPFDILGIGKIQIDYLPVVVGLWVDEWRQSLQEGFNEDTSDSENKKCDFNSDRMCNTKDFSILLFYIER